MSDTGLLKSIFGMRRIKCARESFIILANLMMRLDIRYEGLRDEGDGVSFYVSEYRYLRLRSAGFKEGEQGITTARTGLPYLIYRYRKRIGIPIGIAIMLTLTRISTLYVWDVRIEGNQTLSDASVTQSLEELGFGVGSKISETDFYGLCHRLLLLNDGISWVSVNMEGTRAVVKLKERKASGVGADNNSPSNLVAEIDGEIIRTETVSGQLEIKVGQTVRAGELLVSGVKEVGQGDSGRFVLVRSRGRIFAKTKRVIVTEVPLSYDETTVLSQKCVKKSLIFFGKTLKLQENYSILGDNCDIIRTDKRIVLFENMSKRIQIPLPIVIRSEYLPVTRKTHVTLTEEEALAEANVRVSLTMLDIMPEAELISRESYYEIVGETLVLTVTLECIEDIASETFIGVA